MNHNLVEPYVKSLWNVSLEGSRYKLVLEYRELPFYQSTAKKKMCLVQKLGRYFTITQISREKNCEYMVKGMKGESIFFTTDFVV